MFVLVEIDVAVSVEVVLIYDVVYLLLGRVHAQNTHGLCQLLSSKDGYFEGDAAVSVDVKTVEYFADVFQLVVLEKVDALHLNDQNRITQRYYAAEVGIKKVFSSATAYCPTYE